jgi:RNA polymerase sigma-70 factor (ECF subfamily)
MNDKNAHYLFEQIVQQNKGIIYKVVRTYCYHEDDYEDLVQEIMIQIWRSLPKYRNQFALTTWIYRISINVAISFYRKNALRQNARISLNDQHQLSTDELPDHEKEERLRLLEQFISELNELDRAFMLLYLENKSHVEISEILGFSLSNVGTRIGRIKGKLKIKFSQLNS